VDELSCICAYNYVGVGGVKGCQVAGPSTGEAWQREKRESLENTLRRKLACCLCAICVLLSVIDAVPLPIRG